MTVQLSGTSRLFPIIGDPIIYVESPVWLSETMAQRGYEGLCVPMQVAENDLDSVMAGLTAAGNVDGILVTMPHKQATFEYCSSTSDRASRLRVLSVMRRNPDGTWHGDMLDGRAFVKAQKDQGATIAGKKALLMGAGGAGSAIAVALLEEGVRELVICETDVSRAQALVDVVVDYSDRVSVGNNDVSGYDLVFNATPLGMNHEDPLPFDVARLGSSTFVGDVIAGHGTTPLIAAAQEVGCATATGGHMVEAVQDLMADFMLESS